MHSTEIITKLEQNLTTFTTILNSLNEEEYRYKQSPEKWSALEIICHLRDEEKEDFRVRIKLALEDPNIIPPPFNPPALVLERKYAEQDFLSVFIDFEKERKTSIAWLKNLNNPNWHQYPADPERRKRSPYYYLKNWLAHDYLHIKQLIRLKYDYLDKKSDGDLNYAGKWT